MSLNGLEASEVNEAYHAALNDGGCWFILKYSTRDEVTLHSKGNGGVVEAQEAVKGYGEELPLYGFIHFRRRKVILKYIPEGTSRLLQARVAVHFQAIEDKLTPRDAIFTFTRAEDLRESALSSEIALHTAASIRSTSESHLSGITEDETDTKSEATQKPDGAEGGERKESSSSRDDAQTRHEKANEILIAMRGHDKSPSNASILRPRTASDTNKALPPTPTKNIPHHTKLPSVHDLDARSSVSGINGRMSSQSARPSTRDLSNAYEYKSKVKLGPRPSTDSVGRTGSSAANGGFRPISALPAGLRMPARKAEPNHPASEQKNTPFTSTPPPTMPLPPPPPTTPSHYHRPRTPTSFSRQAPSVKNHESKAAAITPEKKKLMKALQLRQKQLAAQKNPETRGPQDTLNAEINTEKSQSPGIKSILAEHPHWSTDHDPKNPSVDTSECRYHNLAEKDSALEVYRAPSPSIPHGSQDSPTSGAEQSEGHSTQASSVSGEEPPTQKSSHNSGETIKAEGTVRDEVEKRLLGELSPELALKELNSPSQAEILEKNAELPLENSESKIAPVIYISPTEPLNYDVPLMKHESLAASANLVSTYKKQESSTIEFGGDGQEDSSQSPASFSDPDITSKVKDQAPEDLRLEVFDSMPNHAEISSLDPSKTGSQSAQQTISATEVNSGHMLGRALLEQTEEDIDDSDDDDDDDLRIPIQLNIELEKAVESHFPNLQLLKEMNSDTGIGISPSSYDEPQAPEAHVTGDSKESITTTKKLQPSETKLENLDIKNDQRHETPAEVTDKDESDVLEGSNIALKLKLTPSRKEDDSYIALNPATLISALREDETPMARPSTAETVTEPIKPDSIGDTRKELTKGSGVVSHLRRTSSPEQSDEQFLSDDSFMEELKTVSVQEAKPVSVSKSPIRPVFSRNSSEPKLLEKPKAMRSVSSSLGDRPKAEDAFSPATLSSPSPIRSFSGSHAPYLTSQSNFIPAPKKIGVSSSISKRIKALEQSSSQPTSPTLQATPHATFISLRERKSSLKSRPATPDANGFPASLGRSSMAHFPPSTPSDPLKLDPGIRPSRSRPESVSVTATIIRGVDDKSVRKLPDPFESSKVKLHPSPLLVEHQTTSPPFLPPLEPPRPRFARHASARSGSSSSSELKKDMSPKTSRRESFASWRSGSSRNGSDLDLPRSHSDRSMNGGSSLDGFKEEKKDSKRSRLLKRMSNISSVSRRSIASALSPGPKEPSIIEHQEPITQPRSSAIDIGDVNIQFPDTLLWKRRHMLIDEHGVLVLSPSISDRSAKVLTKRFPLIDFKSPYIPDQDRQELPNSVILDFKDGSTLQCACENSRGQADILNCKQLHIAKMSKDASTNA